MLPVGAQPKSEPGKSRSSGARAWLPVAAVVGVLGVSVLVLLTALPVRHQVPETFRIGESSGFGCPGSPNITSPEDGSLTFSWITNDSRSVTVYVDRGQAGPGPSLQVYSATGPNGSGDIQILTGYSYVFEMCNPPTTVRVSGTLYYSAPLF
jgi:hypothetical protein